MISVLEKAPHFSPLLNSYSRFAQRLENAALIFKPVKLTGN